MAWAQEMKNLAVAIKTSHQDRTGQIREIKKDTRNILSNAAADLKAAAKDLRDFLAKSEDTRKKDFDVLIKAVRGTVKDIKGDTANLLAQYDAEIKKAAAELHTFLTESESRRMSDFKALIKTIKADVDAIVSSTQKMLRDYGSERKEAAGYWAGLSKKTQVHQVAEHKE